MSKFTNFFAKLFGRGNEVTIGDSPAPARIPKGMLLSSGGYATTAGAKHDGGLSYSQTPQHIDHTRARRNARAAYLDSIQAHAIVNRFADTVIDTGLRIKPQPQARLLGLTDEQASKWASDIEARFHLWAVSKGITRSNTMNLYQLQRLIEICQQRDGEYFVRFYYDAKAPGNGLQLRLVDASLIKGYPYTATDGTTFSKDGIRRDASGREIGFEVVSYRNGKYHEEYIPARGKRSGLPMMVHGFAPEWPEQVRGYPRYFHALQEFSEISNLSLAHIRKAINQSNITMFVKPNQDNPASNPFGDILQDSPAGPATVENDGQLVPDAMTPLDDRLQYIPIKEASFGVPGSVGVFNLMEGEDLKAFQDTAPSEQFSSFIDSFMSHLSSSLSIPIEVLQMKFGQNYSASRGALILFWRIAQIWRAEMASDFLNPVYEAWLAGEVASGRVEAPGFADPYLRTAWTSTQWSGVPMPNIDPHKTAKADQAYVEMGAQTLADVAHDLNGSNVETNMAQLSRELEKLPIPPWASNADAGDDMEEPQDEGGSKKKSKKDRDGDGVINE